MLRLKVESLRASLEAEYNRLSRKLESVLAEWHSSRPVSGDIPPTAAITTLDTTAAEITRLKADFELIDKARISLQQAPSPIPCSFGDILDEIQALKSVWTTLSKVWSIVFDLERLPWNDVVPRKVRTNLENLLGMMREMPSAMRQYAAFEFLHDHLKCLAKDNSLVAELKSDAFRDRHWGKLFHGIKSQPNPPTAKLTLGPVWELNLTQNEKLVRAILTEASGEFSLESFLAEVCTCIFFLTVSDARVLAHVYFGYGELPQQMPTSSGFP